MAYKWGVILTTYDTWDDPPSTANLTTHDMVVPTYWKNMRKSNWIISPGSGLNINIQYLKPLPTFKFSGYFHAKSLKHPAPQKHDESYELYCEETASRFSLL